VDIKPNYKALLYIKG